MNALDQLKELLNQKTVSTKKLEPLVLEVEKMYVQTAERVKNQKKTINELGEKNQELKRKNKKTKNESAQLALELSVLMMEKEQRRNLRKTLGLKEEVRFGKIK